MTEQGEGRPLEEKQAAVAEWVSHLAETGEVRQIDGGLVREVVTSLGADFEQSEERLAVLGKYSNKGKAPGMKAVWGEERFRGFKTWVDGYITEYEARTGKELPVLVGKKDGKIVEVTDIKYAGMRQWLGELTAFAAGQLDFDKYKRLTEDRWRKGKIWEGKGEGEKIPSSPHALFPPEFPLRAWGYLFEEGVDGLFER